MWLQARAWIFFSILCETCIGTPPLALHQLVEVEPGGEVVLKLNGLDVDGDKTVATITSLPESGTLYQVSHLFDNHGYDPKTGVEITETPCKVIGKEARVVYKRPTSYQYQNGEWGRFNYQVSDKESTSLDGTVVLVPPSKVIVASDFWTSDEGWTTVGNRPNGVTYERSSRGIMTFYIYAADNSLNIGRSGSDDDVWYFQLPPKFSGWHGIAYDGRFEFDLSSFGGDFSPERQNHPGKLNLVEIYCARCNHNHGETYGFPLSATSGFNGETTSFSLALHESAGWLKDPKSTELEWILPTNCEMIELLSGISNIRILGDFTTWYESISIDNIKIAANIADGRYQLPVCAQTQPDGRRCKC